MSRFKLLIEYDGTDFVGWQSQTNGRSVQRTIETALHELFSSEIRLNGAGRTDSGVHARGQVAHFDAETALPPDTIRNALNARLGPDLTIRNAEEVPDDFHARFSASSRRYTYRILTERSSLLRHDHFLCYAELNLQRMEDAAKCLAGTHDFTTMSKFSENAGHCFCHVFSAGWSGEGPVFHFNISANRFLTGMVRAIVGGLVLVGRGKLTVQEFSALLPLRDRRFTPQLAPPHGLTLEEVKYDPVEFDFIRRIMNELGTHQQKRNL
jgi:tRNA pseudouridine38-40 synthase